MRRSQQRSLWT